MHSNLNFLLVTATCFVSICTAIRVEWNTNTGPIIPPTPRTTVRPMPPFREPAPVWEDLSNDIPNPNPYIYVPPPPSRPKQRLNTNVNYNLNDNNKNYGTIVTPYQQNNYNSNNNNSPQVASLAPQYIPNVGTRYVAVVPHTTVATKSLAINNKYPQSSATNALSPDDKNSYKLQGKYNVKTKKYKAYEKVKYVPLNYYSPFKPSNITTEVPSPFWFKQINEQQLPSKTITKQWSSPFVTITTTTTKTSIKTSTPTKSYSKYVYVKDTSIKPKEKFNDSVDKAKKS